MVEGENWAAKSVSVREKLSVILAEAMFWCLFRRSRLTLKWTLSATHDRPPTSRPAPSPEPTIQSPSVPLLALLLSVKRQRHKWPCERATSNKEEAFSSPNQHLEPSLASHDVFLASFCLARKSCRHPALYGCNCRGETLRCRDILTRLGSELRSSMGGGLVEEG